MYNHQYQYEKNARRNRRKALFLAIVFHALILGAVLYGNSEDWREWLPQPVQEMLGMTQISSEQVVAETPQP